MQPPRSFEVRSFNGQCVAYADAAASRIIGSSLDDKGKKELWVIPEHQQIIKLADDCRGMMALYPGYFALMWQDYIPSTVVLTFYDAGKLLRRISLGEIYPNIDELPQSVSHYTWAKAAGWEGGKWFIQTVDDRKIFFDPVTGQRLK